MLTRRDMIRMGLVGAGYALLPSDKTWSPVGSAFADGNAPASPATTPFLVDLPIPPAAVPVERTDFYNTVHIPRKEHERYVLDPNTPAPDNFYGANRFFHVVAEERPHSFHPQIPDTLIWGYRDANPNAPTGDFGVGPTLGGPFGFGDLGNSMLVRHENALPKNHKGFGVPITTVHFHGGHHLATSDGFPTNITGFDPFITMPGGAYDHCFPLVDPGFENGVPDNSERPAMLWYHDHFLDFTGQNVYRGLAGVALMFDEIDTGDEEDPNPGALLLPSDPFDIPLVFQDKRFNRDGSLWFNTFDHDGFIGDKFCVNGVVQPKLEVQSRRYRFRFLNASNARSYQFFLTNDLNQTFPMTIVATEGGLLASPVPNTQSFQLGVAERIEVVIDFSQLPGQTFYIENRLAQSNGRKPDGLVSRGTKLLKFVKTGPDVVVDPSRCGVPDGAGGYTLRTFAPIDAKVLQKAKVKTFEFNRDGGAWTINGKLAGDLETPISTSPVDEPEIWRLVNKSGGWWHPIHIHSEFGRVIKRNGRTPGPTERDGQAKKDTYLLRDNETVEVFLQFRDYKGPFVFHCHNLAHEDMAMMGRFDVV
jgi:FtsP/CotA-like multicopper oxidase with cupredoxin domain